MDLNKLEFIENYFYEHCEDDFLFVVLHSLFNCISNEELMIFYFHNAKGNAMLKKTIESYVVKRTTNEPKRQFNNIAETLLNNYTKENYQTQITTRKFVSQFIRTLPIKTVRQFFDIFINSERKYDRHRANEVSDLIWDDETEGILLDNFYKYLDEYSLLPLIKGLDSESLCRLIKKYWTPEFPSLRLKNSIVKKIYKLDVKYLSFLQKKDISFYVQALTLKRIKISDKEIKQLSKSMTDKNKYYLIWSFGMTGSWKQTVKYIKKINKKIK